MKRLIFSSLILSGMVAFSANATDGGKLYIEDTAIAPGETAVLSIQLENDIEVSGFQLQLTLPAGITYRNWNFSEDRLPAGVSVSGQFKMHHFKAQTLSVAGILNSGVGESFTQSQGEVGSIEIVASPNLPQGVYIVEVCGIDLSDPMGNDYEVPTTTFKLTVGGSTGIEALNTTGEMAPVYDLQGRRQKDFSENMPYVVNGQMIYRK